MNQRDYEYFKECLLTIGFSKSEIAELLLQKHLSDYLTEKYKMSEEDIKILNFFRVGYQNFRDMHDCLIDNERGVYDCFATRDFVTNPLIKEYLKIHYTQDELKKIKNNLNKWCKKQDKLNEKKKQDEFLNFKAEMISLRIKELREEFYGEEQKNER